MRPLRHGQCGLRRHVRAVLTRQEPAHSHVALEELVDPELGAKVGGAEDRDIADDAVLRDRVVIPKEMASDEFWRLFPLYVVARMHVPADALRDEAQRKRIAQELGETVVIEGPEFLFAFHSEGEKFDVPRGDLTEMGREMVRDYFHTGGVDFDESDMEQMTSRVEERWKLRNSPLAVTSSAAAGKPSIEAKD